MYPIRRGVSFLEVTVVIMIIGLLAAVAVPRFSRAARMRDVRNATIQTAGYVDYIRDLAINQGRTVRFSVDANADVFSSPDAEFPDRAGVLISVDLQERFDPSIELTASFDGATTMGFDLEGNPMVSGSAMSSGVITILSFGEGYQILIEAGQGTTSIVPFDFDDGRGPAPDAIQVTVHELDLGSLSLDEGGI